MLCNVYQYTDCAPRTTPFVNFLNHFHSLFSLKPRNAQLTVSPSKCFATHNLRNVVIDNYIRQFKDIDYQTTAKVSATLKMCLSLCCLDEIYKICELLRKQGAITFDSWKQNTIPLDSIASCSCIEESVRNTFGECKKRLSMRRKPQK